MAGQDTQSTPPPQARPIEISGLKTVQQTTTLAPSSSDGFWEKAGVAFFAALPGVIVAVFVVVISHRLQRKRDGEQASRSLALAQLQHQADRIEAIRSESTQRRLDAIETLGQSVVGMVSEADAFQQIAYDATGANIPADAQANMMKAQALVSLYFSNPNLIDPEWSVLKLAYLSSFAALGNLRREVYAYAHQAAYVGKQFGATFVAHIQPFEAVVTQARTNIKAAETAMLAKLSTITPAYLN